MKELQTATIWCGDNLNILRKFPNKCIDLIYADPPFFSNRHYEVIWNDGAELRAFEDRWQGGIEHYTKWMRDRLMECHRVLKDTGSMYLHCDWHANAHLRIIMDEIFGVNNFQNEIIWHYGLGGSSPKRWQRKHDNILFYSKTDKWNFTPNMIPATSLKMAGLNKKDSDVWNIASINNMATERIGYPTQKPEALLRRIVEASSNKGDIILDPFCGCGTTISVAHQLGRQWIGIDVSPTACRMMADRLNKLGLVAKLEDMPDNIEYLKSIEPFEFQYWVVRKITGTNSNKKSSDMGIDGYDFLNKPIQVKQSSNIGRNIVDNFETAIKRAGFKEGTIYAFSFGKGAKEEVARASLEEKVTIKLATISELLDDNMRK